MEKVERINQNAKADKNSGFGTNSSSYGGRFINKNGKANVEKQGMHVFHRIAWYHTMIEMNTWRFMFIILSFCLRLLSSTQVQKHRRPELFFFLVFIRFCSRVLY